jgi:hypothetical protein
MTGTEPTTHFYGACGVENCADCLPLYDLDNNPIAGTDDPEVAEQVAARLTTTEGITS